MIYPLLLILSDLAGILLAFTLAYILRVQIDTRPLVLEIPAIEFIKVFIILSPLLILINALLGLYTKPVYEKRLPELGRILVAAFLGILLIIGYDFTLDRSIFPARLVPVYGFIGTFIILALFRNILWVFRRYLFRFGYGVRNVLIVGSGNVTKNFASQLADTLSSGYTIKAIVGDKNSLPPEFDGKHYSKLTEALKDVRTLGIHTVIQTSLYERNDYNRMIFETVRNQHLQYKFIPALSEFYTGKNTTELILGYPVISVHQTPLIGWGRVVKRFMDVALTLIALIPALPIMFILAIIIKLTDPKGPVIYKHKRMTRYNNEFYIYKLRSMYWKYSTGDAASKKSDEEVLKEMGREDLIEEYKKNHKLERDPRVMPVGDFMRKTSLDELPQLFNVLQGKLSLVGPRAMTREELEKYKTIAGGHVVLSVKSGITGLWQVSGRSNLSIDERVRLELFYVQNWSLLMDLRILFKTVWVVLKRTGAK